MDDQGWQVNGEYERRHLLHVRCGQWTIDVVKGNLDGTIFDDTKYCSSCCANDENSGRQPSNEATPRE